jgi:predicted metal-dependent phosphotriesterase family hydrolase
VTRPASGIGRASRRGFTDRELDMMFKDNPAKLLDLPTP